MPLATVLGPGPGSQRYRSSPHPNQSPNEMSRGPGSDCFGRGLYRYSVLLFAMFNEARKLEQLFNSFKFGADTFTDDPAADGNKVM
jgi:hypothetical protein